MGTMLACGIVTAGLTIVVHAAEEEKTHTGTVVSASATQLVMKSAAGAEHTMKAADKVTVTLDGKEAKLADLKAGSKVTVTTNAAGSMTKVVATSVKPTTDPQPKP